ncbi:MAG: YfiR family protein [Burkholderiales bacterium]
MNLQPRMGPLAHRSAAASAPRSRAAGWARGCTTVALLLGAVGAHASDPDLASQKAEFAVNFAKFTDWPPGRFPLTAGTFALCQYRGSAQLTRALMALSGRTIQGYKIEYRRIERIAEAPNCMLLFAGGRPPQLKPEDSVLTVGDGAQFAQQGGMIGFVIDGDKLKFEVNLAAMQRSGLSISSAVLSLATNVIEPAPRMHAGQPPTFIPATAIGAPTVTMTPIVSAPESAQMVETGVQPAENHR